MFGVYFSRKLQKVVGWPAACVAQGTVKLIKEPAGKPVGPETGSGTRREPAEPDDLNINTGNTAFCTTGSRVVCTTTLRFHRSQASRRGAADRIRSIATANILIYIRLLYYAYGSMLGLSFP